MEGSQTHLNFELQALGSGNLPLPTSYKCLNHLAHISTYKTSTRTSILEHGVKSCRDLKEARNSRFAGAQGAEVRNEEALRVLNPQGRGSKRSPALLMGEGRVHKVQPRGEKYSACAARCQTGERKLCAVKLLKCLTLQVPYSIEHLFDQAF